MSKKRRNFTAQFKLETVLDGLRGEKTVAQICRERDITDITYIRLGRRFIYLAVILDAYTRAVRGWALSRTIDQQLTLDALDMALTHGRPSIFHSDQGSQYAAWLHTDRLLEHRIKISMSDKASPTQPERLG